MPRRKSPADHLSVEDVLRDAIRNPDGPAKDAGPAGSAQDPGPSQDPGHEAAIESSRQSLRSLLAPILALHPQPQSPPDTQPFDRAQLLRDLIHSLFAGRRAPAAFDTPETMLASLHALLG